MATTMKTITVATDTNKQLLAPADHDRDVLVGMATVNTHAIATSSINAAAEGYVLQDTTTRFTLAAGQPLYFFAAGAAIAVSVVATDIDWSQRRNGALLAKGT